MKGSLRNRLGGAPHANEAAAEDPPSTSGHNTDALALYILHLLTCLEFRSISARTPVFKGEEVISLAS